MNESEAEIASVEKYMCVCVTEFLTTVLFERVRTAVICHG